MDPLAEIPGQIAHSPYAYAWNNPISMIDPTGMSAEECKDCPPPKDGDKNAGTGYGDVTVSASRIYDLPDFSAINKSNQNSQAGWGGTGESGSSGDYKSPNVSYAQRYFNPNRPLSSGEASPDYTIESFTLLIFGFLKALKIPGIQSWFKGLIGSSSRKIAVQFGKNQSQIYHAFRHTDALGMDRSLIQSTIQNHFKMVSSQVVAGKPLNQVVEIGGQKIQYTAFKLSDGTINIGRIHGVN